MLLCMCGSKGGVGTSTLVAAAALEASHETNVLLLDLAGDQERILGVSEPDGDGVWHWFAAPGEVGAERLGEAAEQVQPGLSLLGPRRRFGSQPLVPETVVGRLKALKEWSDQGNLVIVDAGQITGNPFALEMLLPAFCDQTVVVTRPCYLSLARLAAIPFEYDALVEVSEPGRALRTIDIELVAKRPVTKSVAYSPNVGRAIDSGLLSTRMPRQLKNFWKDLVTREESDVNKDITSQDAYATDWKVA